MPVVAHEQQLPAALSALRASMADSCVAIDLEWKPEGWAGNGASRVALMQLASATVAVLVRVSQIGFRMPPALRSFLRSVPVLPVLLRWGEGACRPTGLPCPVCPPALPDWHERGPYRRLPLPRSIH